MLQSDEELLVIYANQILVGLIELMKKEEGIEIGYRIGKHYRQNGYGKQAIKKTTLTLDNLGMKLCARVSKDNLASIKILEYCGYQRYKEESDTLYYHFRG